MKANFNVIGIDASRVRSGGAVRHILGILEKFKPGLFPGVVIHVWSYRGLLVELPDAEWLVKHDHGMLESSLVWQLIWQRYVLPKECGKYNIEVLFACDASTLSCFNPLVVLSQDLLSYEPGIIMKFGFGYRMLRLHVLRAVQNAAFRRADGVIFLCNYAEKLVQNSCGTLSRTTVVPHGVDDAFGKIAGTNDRMLAGSGPIRLLYVSNTSAYKFQWNVVIAVEALRRMGLNLELVLVGGGEGAPQRKLERQIRLSDPKGLFVRQIDFVDQTAVLELMESADIFVFASACENLPITLLEAMKAGLPIACSDRGPMPEILKDAGIYFDPERPDSIASAINSISSNQELRQELACKAQEIVSKYTWDACSEFTIEFLRGIQLGV